MEVGGDELVRTMIAHQQAAWRLRGAMRKYPGARRGLARCLREHQARAGTLANEIGCGAWAGTQASEAMPTA